MLHPSFELPMDAIGDVCRRYGVKELAVFGSAVREDFTSTSDVDFLVEFEADAEVTFRTYLDLEEELAALVRRKVDLVPKDGLKRLIRDRVLNSRKVLYAS